MLSLLSQVWARLGRSRAARRALRSSGIRHVSRAWLRTSASKAERTHRDDVTVLIGVRDRVDYRIENALRSVAGQIYPGGEVKTLVVDYGSQAAGRRTLQHLCDRFEAVYVRVEASGIWSRARCLNVGLRLVDTEFAMVSDADILLSPRYVADAVKVLKQDPLSVVCSPMLDLPETLVESVREVALTGAPLPLEAWKEQSVPRLDREMHSSIALTYSRYYRLIRGYDEGYEGWGREDADLMKRFRALGLETRAPSPSSFYLHQWHRKYEGLTEAEHAESLARNSAHYRANHSILRNGPDWGLVGS
jgi:hypothetical protein